MHTKILSLLRNLTLGMMALLCSPAWSQHVDFHSNATSNACIEQPGRAILQLQHNCNVQLGPGNATVLDCRLHQVGAAGAGWHGIFVPVGAHAVPVGWACFFESCGPGGLTLTCFLPAVNRHHTFQMKDKLTVKFDKKTSQDPPPKE